MTDASIELRRESKTRTRATLLPRSILRRVRKHRDFLIAFAILQGIIFFPTFFFARILSPNDVFYNYDPWRAHLQVETQNALVHDPPVTYLTLISMLKSDPSSFHWNRYIGCGIPGFGSAGASVLTPLIALPALLLPLQLVYSGIVFLKIAVSLFFAYLWLREERLGKRAAAVGAVVFAGAGIFSVWWLWQGTNATVLYPALLWALRRAFGGKRNSIALLALLGICFGLAGFPATIAYGAYLAILYAVFLAVRFRRLPFVELGKTALGALLAAVATAPPNVAFYELLQRTGHLDERQTLSGLFFYPWTHLKAFINPYRLGDPATHTWVGDHNFGPMNNFVEATVYVGTVTIPLAFAGLFRRRSAMTWFSLGLTVALVLVMFGGTPLGHLLAPLPGLKYTPLPRIRVLLPIPLAFLCASGMLVLSRLAHRFGSRFRVSVQRVLLVAVAADLAFFAAHFYPYLRWDVATLPASETVTFLQSQKQPARFTAFFPYLFPNTSELYRLEDIRTHFGPEKEYRDFMKRLDPESLDVGRIIMFNSLNFNLHDPLLSFLNVRYLVEQPSIDILHWKIDDETTPVAPITGTMWLRSGDTMERSITLADGPVWGVSLPFSYQSSSGTTAAVTMSLVDSSGETIASSSVGADELKRRGKLYVAVPQTARGTLRLRVFSNGVWAQVGSTAAAGADSPLAAGLIRLPLILVHEFDDGRVFENLAVSPRFFAVWNVAQMTREQFLQNRTLDLATTASVEIPEASLASRLAAVPQEAREARFRVGRFSNSAQTVQTESAVPFLLASSEKITPELRIRVDGKAVGPLRINTIFAGVPIEAGKHVVVFEWRIARGWWLPAFIALTAILVIGGFEIRQRRRGRATMMI